MTCQRPPSGRSAVATAFRPRPLCPRSGSIVVAQLGVLVRPVVGSLAGAVHAVDAVGRVLEPGLPRSAGCPLRRALVAVVARLLLAVVVVVAGERLLALGQVQPVQQRRALRQPVPARVQTAPANRLLRRRLVEGRSGRIRGRRANLFTEVRVQRSEVEGGSNLVRGLHAAATQPAEPRVAPLVRLAVVVLLATLAELRRRRCAGRGRARKLPE